MAIYIAKRSNVVTKHGLFCKASKLKIQLLLYIMGGGNIISFRMFWKSFVSLFQIHPESTNTFHLLELCDWWVFPGLEPLYRSPDVGTTVL